MKSELLLFATLLFATTGCGDLTAADCTDTEAFVAFGSDIAGEGTNEDCVALPEECLETPTCDCLGTVQGTIGWSFCVEEGTCAATPDGLELTCPGG
ncbi:MAG: hypothetical protein AAGN82_11625 [Myxococcota bacterium]